MKATFQDAPIIVDPHFTPGWYAEIWGVDARTVKRWFEDRSDVLKLQTSSRKGTRTEIRIPYSVAMKVYSERTRCR